jgi:hypothetical protein
MGCKGPHNFAIADEAETRNVMTTVFVVAYLMQSILLSILKYASAASSPFKA